MSIISFCSISHPSLHISYPYLITQYRGFFPLRRRDPPVWHCGDTRTPLSPYCPGPPDLSRGYRWEFSKTLRTNDHIHSSVHRHRSSWPHLLCPFIRHFIYTTPCHCRSSNAYNRLPISASHRATTWLDYIDWYQLFGLYVRPSGRLGICTMLVSLRSSFPCWVVCSPLKPTLGASHSPSPSPSPTTSLFDLILWD